MAVWVLMVVSLGAAMEWFARSQLGLGDPPLSVPHPVVEYLFKPNQDVLRFGNRIRINAYGMRSEEFSETKPASEFRLLVFGDSVLNGGSLIDQADLATELLRDRLERCLHRPVVVGNVSAGSWGPGNWLGYAREYGFFESDVVVLLISTHDHRDNPTFADLNPHTHPQESPVLAVWEGVTRYLPRYLPKLSDFETLSRWFAGDSGPSVASSFVVHETQAAKRGLADLEAFLDLAQTEVGNVIVAQFLERSELLGRARAGYFLIKNVALSRGVHVASTAPWFRAALESGRTPFRDNIHINADGQTVLADALWDMLQERLERLAEINTGIEGSLDEQMECR